MSLPVSLRQLLLMLLAWIERYRFFKFGIVGASGVVVNLLVVFISHEYLFSTWEPPNTPYFSYLLGILLSTINNFTWNRLWTWADRVRQFEASEAPRPTHWRLLGMEFSQYATSCAMGMVLQYGIALQLTSYMDYRAANIVAIVAASVLNFVANDRWTFRHNRAPSDAAIAAWPWVLVLLGCLGIYLFALGSPYAPTNGDEMVYIHIARMTMESGQWLPLQSELFNTRNTKPPLLIWQAMVAGGWGHWWDMFWLRLPSVLYTFGTTALIAFFAHHLTREARQKWRHACIAAVLYLLFFSTFRYGRAYLTSAPETFWLALPLWWLLWQRVRGLSLSPPRTLLNWRIYTGFGIAFGLGAAYKSFALIAPAAATIWCAIVLSEPQLRWPLLWRSALGVAWSVLLGLGIFALWFVLDPNPAAVWQEFIVAENAGKLSNAMGYWQAAWNGPYPLWPQLFAYAANAGLLVLPTLGFCLLMLWRGRRWSAWRSLSPALRVLLVWALVWFVVFLIPSQRSERYVIPAMPAIALGMMLVWPRIPRLWFVLTLPVLLGALLMLARITWVIHETDLGTPSLMGMTLLAAGVGLVCGTIGLVRTHWSRHATLLTTACTYACFSLMVQPLSSPANATYPASVLQQVAGQRIAVPNGFTGQYERFQFILPGARFTPYDAEGRNTGALYPDQPAPERLERLLQEFDAVVWLQNELTETGPSCLPHCTVLGQRWHVKSRHKPGEVTLSNLWYPHEWLFRREWLVQRQASAPH